MMAWWLKWSMLWVAAVLAVKFTNISAEDKIPYVPYVVVDKQGDEFDYDKLHEAIVNYLHQNQDKTLIKESLERGLTLYEYLKETNQLEAASKSKPVRISHPLGDTILPLHQVADAVRMYGRDNYTYGENAPGNNYQSYSNPRLSYANTEYPFVGASPPSTAVSAFQDTGIKCSLKSSRYVFDGECVSKKPIVETVCADRCIGYVDYGGGGGERRNYHANEQRQPSYQSYPVYQQPQRLVRNGSPNSLPYTAAHRGTLATTSHATPVRNMVALACRDGHVKKSKVKLYCKDGTIIHNVIRIVSSCHCQPHTEKVKKHKRVANGFVRGSKNRRSQYYQQRRRPRH